MASVGAGQEDNPLLSIRILEKQNPQKLEVQCPPDKGPWSEVKLTRGQLSVNGKALPEASWGTPGGAVKIRAGNFTRIYPGQIRISTSQDEKGVEFFILDEVPLLDYAACVTASESGYDPAQPEYLKALAVVVRCYALSHRRRHPGYDLCDLAHCQVYQGLPPRFGFWRGIVEAGRNFSFRTGTDLKSLYFHRCCGGRLDSADQIWGGPPGPSRTGPDELDGQILCRADPFFRWNTSTPAGNVEAVFRAMAGLPPGSILESFNAVEKTKQGRNRTFAARFRMPDGSLREVRVNAQRFVSEFGRLYGWRVFPGLWFDIRRQGDLFHFSGRGFGHGVGLCQSGATRLADLGWNWEEILGFYFPAAARP